MIKTMSTAWLYAYSPNADSPQYTYYTVYTGNPNGAAVFATGWRSVGVSPGEVRLDGSRPALAGGSP